MGTIVNNFRIFAYAVEKKAGKHLNFNKLADKAFEKMTFKDLSTRLSTRFPASTKKTPSFYTKRLALKPFPVWQT